MLNFPLVERCAQLNHLIDRCSLKELQDYFPLLVNSIFGNVPAGVNPIGWGLRSICRQTNPNEFDVLYSFFQPLGPMFRLCYRLLNDPIKFDVPIEMLPSRTGEMLHSARYPPFYSEMINIDPNRRQIVSLSLNAFDFFLMHFILHGTVPLHRLHPAALAVHNEKWKTLYFYLTADFVCTFMPSHPDSAVLPTNICGSVKMATVMPIQPIQPTRSPKYLKLSALTHTVHSGGGVGSVVGGGVGTFQTPPAAMSTPKNIRTTADSAASMRTYSWRTESALYLFVDLWLRIDVEEHRDLPSSEFVRVVRILVKQLHAFGNSADLDGAVSMGQLRYLAQPMMNAQMYTFLRGIIKRWPLDSSFSAVLELWLSYIQPWRYTFERNIFLDGHGGGGSGVVNIDAQPIHRRFEPFIKDNIAAYTQIYLQLLPRFELLDFSSLKNVHMFFRVLKVFGQTNLSDILRAIEFDVYAATTKSFISSSPKKTAADWTAAVTAESSPSHQQYRTVAAHSFLQQQQPHDVVVDYGCMFGDEVHYQMRRVAEKMMITVRVEREHAARLAAEQSAKVRGFVNWIKNWLAPDVDLVDKQALDDCRKIPDLLDVMLQTTANLFKVGRFFLLFCFIYIYIFSLFI